MGVGWGWGWQLGRLGYDWRCRQELESRLRNRQTESEETIRVRLQRAKDELVEMDELYKDISIINGDLEVAVGEMIGWVKKSFFE